MDGVVLSVTSPWNWILPTELDLNNHTVTIASYKYCNAIPSEGLRTPPVAEPARARLIVKGLTKKFAIVNDFPLSKRAQLGFVAS